jgi:hypothetical protein
MGTMDGFFLGSVLGDTSGQTIKALKQRNQMIEERDQAIEERDEALEQVQKLSVALEKEHKRFLIERRERRDYMRGWATRGAILREECGYTKEMIDAGQDKYGLKYDEKLTRIAKETDAEIDAEAGF